MGVNEYETNLDSILDIPNWMMKEMQTACDFSMDIGKNSKNHKKTQKLGGTLVKVAYLSKTCSNQKYRLSDVESDLMVILKHSKIVLK